MQAPRTHSMLMITLDLQNSHHISGVNQINSFHTYWERVIHNCRPTLRTTRRWPKMSTKPPGARHPVAGGQRQPQLLVEGRYALPLQGPVQHAAGLQHGAPQQQGLRQLVILHLLQKHQHQRVTAVLHQLVHSVVSLEPAGGEAIKDVSTGTIENKLNTYHWHV